MRCAVALALLLGSLAANATSVTIGFEPDSIVTLDGYQESGFEFSVASGQGVAGYGDHALLYQDTTTVVLTGSQSQTFDLISLDIASLQNAIVPAELIGTYAGGGQVQTTIETSGTFFETLRFDENDFGIPSYEWTGLASLSISFNSAAYADQLMLDNVVLSSAAPVPVPAALWLFSSGLAGLGWLRRQRAA